MRAGFLFNHDEIHQIAHSLPIALALREQRSGIEPVLVATNPLIAAEVARLAAGAGHDDLAITLLDLERPVSKRAERWLGGLLPARKLLIYRDNLAFFRSLDALVVSERTSLVLKSRYALDLPIILADHGAGDRAIGFGPVAARFDHVLAAGPKIRDRLVAEAGVDPHRISITGYPKFDVCPPARDPLPMQGNGRPTVLYNPHVSPHLSSWFGHGRAVLDWFLANPRYNLIFAPHVMLFRRPLAISIDRLRIARPGTIDRKYREAPNIHIDLGSVDSTNMRYTNAADIYLGDVSSQVYEFLRHPRPCVFISADGRQHRGDPNYAHWRAGPVIDDARDLDHALRTSRAGHAATYRPVQRQLFDYTFSVTGETAGHRAARVLAGLLAPRPPVSLHEVRSACPARDVSSAA